MKDEKKNKKMMRAVGSIGDDLLTEAIGDEKRSAKPKRKKILFAILASVLVLLMIAGSIALIAANRPKDPSADASPDGTAEPTDETALPSVEKEPIVFSGKAYSNGATVDLPEALKEVKISVGGSDDRIIGVDSIFTVETAEDCDEETLAEYMSVLPQTEFSVRRKSNSGKIFEIAPASGTLDPGTVYRVVVGDPANPSISYAFQTETQLVIKNTIPADLAGEVPTNTGIEIVFSEALEPTDYARYFAFSPEISGRFELYPDGKTLAFIPNDPLDESSIYFVTVKEGLTSRSGKPLKTEKTICFTTSGGTSTGVESDRCYFTVDPIERRIDADNSYYRTAGIGVGTVFSSGEEAYARFQIGTARGGSKAGFTTVSYAAELYRFLSAAAAYEVFKYNEEHALELINNGYSYDLSKLDLVRTDNGSFDTTGNGNNLTVSFGNGLQKGVYLVKLEANSKDHLGRTHEASAYALIQVSDLRSAAVAANGEALIYTVGVNGLPAKNVRVSGSSFKNTIRYSSYYYYKTVNATDFSPIDASTDEKGVCTFNTGSSSAILAYLTKDGDELLISTSCSEERSSRIYQKFIYTDRQVYFSSDRVNIYGYLVPAFGAELPEKLYLQVGSSGMRKAIELNEDGSFTGSYVYEDRQAGYFYISIVDENDNVLAVITVQVTREEKPVIRTEMFFDRAYAEYGDTVTGYIKASYFDGTPAAGYAFDVYSYNYARYITVKKDADMTDENGLLKFSFVTRDNDARTTDPVTVMIYAHGSGYDTQKISCSASIPYYHSDKVFSYVYEDGGVTLTLNKRDLSGFPNDTVGEPASGSVDYTLIRTTYYKTEHTGYDTYSKLTYKYYQYHDVQTVVKSGKADFVNGRIKLDGFESDGSNYYHYEVTYNDGRKTFGYNLSAMNYRYGQYTEYSYTYTGLYVIAEANYLLGDAVEATAVLSGIPVDSALFVRTADHIVDYQLGKRYTGTFGTESLLGSYISVLCYDAGSGCFFSGTKRLFFDYERGAMLEVTVEADKEAYKPGETAIIKVKVGNGAGGQAIVSIVDEACFALGDQRTYPLSRLFEGLVSYPSNVTYARTAAGLGMSLADYRIDGNVCGKQVFSTYFSYAERNKYYLNDNEAPMEEPAAEEPHEEETDDSVYIREYFADNPEFRVIALDENGEGTLVVKIPDNMTSWRITCAAVKGLMGKTEDLRAGIVKTDVICTLPFYISPSFCPQYIVGDDVAFNVRAVGKAITGEVVCKAEIRGENGELLDSKTLSLTDNRATFNFGKLESGVYEITVTAACGDATDGVRQKIAVVESAAIANVSRDVTPEELSRISPALYPIMLGFCDESESYRLFSAVVSRLAYNDSVRSDALLAKFTALKAREKLFGVSSASTIDELRRKLNSYGSSYYSLLTYSDADPLLTAQMLALEPSAPDAYRRSYLISAYSMLIGREDIDSPETLCAALLALAALDEPILADICAVAEAAANYPLEAKLYLAAAFAFCGDYPSARDILDETFEAFGVRDEKYGTLYLAANDKDEQVRLTGLALLACCRVSKVDAEMLAAYLLGDTTRAERASLPLAAFLKYYMPTGELTEKTLVYSVGGVENTLKVKGLRSAYIVLNKEEFKSFSILSIDEGVGVHACYKGTLQEATERSDDRLKIKKSVRQTGSNLYSVTLTISGTSTRVYEWFDLYDYVPSGARFVSGAARSVGSGVRTFYSIYNYEAQEMRGYLSVYNKNAKNDKETTTCKEYSFSVTITYTIRGAVPGEYISESAVIVDSNGYSAFSERATVTIR